jgi:hypothetical protein
MLLLRNGGQFTDSQIKKYLKLSAIYFAVAYVGIFVAYQLKAPLFGLIIFALAFTAFKARFSRWGNWFVGKRGELAVTETLKRLPDDYAVLNDLTMPNGWGNIDHVIVAPHGLYVIETKNYSGWVKCIGDEWFVNGRPIKSLSKQAKRNAMTLRNTLAPVFAEHDFSMPYIQSVLVFVKYKGSLNLKDPTVPVLKAEDLVDFIETRARDSQYKKDRADPARIAELKRAIVHRLHALQSRIETSAARTQR